MTVAIAAQTVVCMTAARMPHRTTSRDCQVLVVGAGPTGLVLATDLLERGIHTRVIDKGNGVALETRAIAIHGRALEVLDMMGLADRFVDTGQPVRHFTFYADGRRRVSLDLSLNGTRFGFVLDIPQHQTERLLRMRMTELGGAVEPGVELTNLTDEGSVVTAGVVDGNGQQRSITADYVVGCDGAHSRVRHELGLRFDGHPYPQDWLLADVTLDWARPDDEIHAFFTAGGLPLICFPMRDHQWRVTVPFAGDRNPGPPSLAEIQQLVDQRSPRPLVLSDPTWLANFRCHRRSTETYRSGHVLLAGDAVHIHTPAGGQGMNTGITDAHNLGWKLALVAAGRAPDSLLDTYGTERAPVAEQVLALTHTLVRYATMSSPLKRMIRDAVIPPAARFRPLHRRAVRRWAQVNVGYPDSPITHCDRSRSHPRPGERVPDRQVVTADGTSSLFRVLRSGRHVLIVDGADPECARDSMTGTSYGDLVQIVTAAPDDSRAPRRAGTPAVYLVRSDGYLAARGTPGRLGSIHDYLSALAPQANTRSWAAGRTQGAGADQPGVQQTGSNSAGITSTSTSAWPSKGCSAVTVTRPGSPGRLRSQTAPDPP
jgi:2-polyprenyl-6-methoxyphenol hydroxylase-like FAD-dependent oxidoreductase